MTSSLHLAAFAVYLLAWIQQLRSFRSRDVAPRARPHAIAFAAVGLHVAGLIAFALAHRALPLLGTGPASSTLALVIAVSYLVIAGRPEMRAAGLFLLPVVLLLLGESLVVGLAPAQHETAFRGIWFVTHVAAVFGGYAGLLLASVAGAMYLLQFRALKRKDFGQIFRFFPSLDALDRMNGVGLAGGLLLLSIGLVAGWGFTVTFGAGFAFEDPAVFFGVFTWLVYLGAIAVRVTRGGDGWWTAASTACAFLVTALAFLVLRVTASAPGAFL